MNFHPVIPELRAAAYSALVIALIALGLGIAALSCALVALGVDE